MHETREQHHHLFLRSDASIAEQEVQQRRPEPFISIASPGDQEVCPGSLWLLQACVYSRLEIPQIGENTFFPFLGRFDGSAKGFEAECKRSH